MDSSRKRKTPGWKSSPPSLHLVEKEDSLQKPESLGLYCRETRQLPDCEECGESVEVCNQRKGICIAWNRHKNISQIEGVQERINLRMGGSPNAAGRYHRRIRLGKTCYSSAELKEASRLSEIPEQEKKEVEWIESDSMDAHSSNELSSGFSDDGELDEQESVWFPTDVQGAPVMDIRRHEPWEDFIDDESDEIL